MKSKRNKNYSVIIVPEATSTRKEFVLSSRLIRNAIIGTSVLILIFGFMIFDYLTMSFNRERMKVLEAESIRTEKMLKELDARFKQVSESLVRMNTLKERILVMAGLTSPYALSEVGTGGPINMGTDMEFPGSSTELMPRQPQANLDLMTKTKDVVGQSADIEQSLRFVKEHLVEQKVRLSHTPALWPTRGYLTDGFRWRTNPLTGKQHFHGAQDISTQLGNPIIATADGFVLIAEQIGAMGNVVHIDHGFGYQTRYGHLSSFNVKEGDRVSRGQVIGYVGSTGRSTGPHLHYEVIFMGNHVNPLDFVLD